MPIASPLPHEQQSIRFTLIESGLVRPTTVIFLGTTMAASSPA